ncbi:unnamed protein product [Didymodactylos carnosus]|uniref:Phosphoinositide phospholipase C n=1 Tax=Didymodactylos carnosus TaxID=1234261 RepID=A0A814PQ81_9BILA|nr:unnamed protein product [Didymodactylos carnosus]CAF1109145.1 unnamed protein product [Didymodactylos carnosus]CAF3690338.1 unnamed protein product [Didymodactylos carnosus]CAF3873635.1 unnamed protein product [Didymodactylos carnosus]
MLSEEFDLMNPSYARQPYQDMTKPLTDYYINTSHNTYLFQSQVYGDSNAEAYNRVLLKGGRAVELDCYDGYDGRPIVKHAWTLQKEMARVLKEILQEYLLTEALPTTNPSVLPSPEALKKKVLIRSRQIAQATKATETPPTTETPQEEDEDDSPADPLSELTDLDFAQLLIYMRNVPFRGLEYAQTHSAMNYQTFDEHMRLNYGRFLDNGGCGYVLKPDFLTNPDSGFNPFSCDVANPGTSTLSSIHDKPWHLTLTIISAQYLVNTAIKDLIDPYVRVYTHGVPCDNQNQKTCVINNNGLNPMWNHRMEFDIAVPQLCLIRFVVLDSDKFSSDDIVGQYCVPMNTIQKGYRHVRLREEDDDLSHSTLFVHVDIQQHNENSSRASL